MAAEFLSATILLILVIDPFGNVPLVAAALFVANLVGCFPGEPNDDSNSQYAQAVARHFNDWHHSAFNWR